MFIQWPYRVLTVSLKYLKIKYYNSKWMYLKSCQAPIAPDELDMWPVVEEVLCRLIEVKVLVQQQHFSVHKLKALDQD